MASGGYHSPWFSEDITWLPPWLQPHQIPAFRDGDEDDDAIFQLSCKKQSSLKSNASGLQYTQLSTKEDSEYVGFRLYQSGDDNSPAGNTSSSVGKIHFHLHLSSLSLSQLPASQLNGVPEARNHETSQGSAKKHFHGTPAVPSDTFHSYEHKDETTISESTVGNKSGMLSKQISGPPIKLVHINKQKFQGKPDVGSISDADINDAVELSIAASEAMVISNLATTSLHSENLPAAVILEIALRVKQARKDFSDILEAVPSFHDDDLGENELLSELDDKTMADAFDDVGLTVTEIVGNFESSDYLYSCLNSVQSDFSCDLQQNVSEFHAEAWQEKQKEELKTCGVGESGATSPACPAVASGPISNCLLTKPLPVQHANSSLFVPLDCIKYCSKSQQKVGAQNLQQNTDALISMRTSFKEDGNHENHRVSPPGNMVISKSISKFYRETSYISESMDGMDDRPARHIAEAQCEVVVSSSTPSMDFPDCPCREEFARSICGTHGLSQDLVRSSCSSFVDPLCSLVPCSIPSGDAPTTPDPYQKVTKEENVKSIETRKAVRSEDVKEKPMPCNMQETPGYPEAERVPVLFETKDKKSSIPIQEQLNSLKHYSMAMPDQNTHRQAILMKYQFPIQGKGHNILMFAPAETDNTFVMPDKPAVKDSLKPKRVCTDVDGSNDNLGQGCKDQEVVPSGFAGVSNNDNRLLFPNNECGGPIILNNKKRRLWACKEIFIGDSEKENLEESSGSKIRKYKMSHSRSEVKWIDSTTLRSHNLQSSFPSGPADEKTCKGSRHRSGKIVNGSSSISKFGPKRDIFNYLTCQHKVHKQGMIFQGLDFLLTGFSSQKEKELGALIRLYGGYVLSRIPSGPPTLSRKQQAGSTLLKLPIVISPKKVQTTKFLYGCATNTWMLNANWLIDSIHAAALLPPQKYMTRVIEGSEPMQLKIGEPFCLRSHTLIFDRVGIMLNGKLSFCTKFSRIIKHGGGKVFKSLQQLVQSLKNGTSTIGAVLVENEGNVSRHLKYCALENNVQTMPASWIVNSLFIGKLLPLKKDRYAPLHRIKMPTFSLPQDDNMSEEI